MKTRIGDISIQIRGVSYKPSDISDENDPQSIAILRANNISNHGEIETSDLVWITQNRVKPEQILRTGDILLCASSGSKGLVGKAAQVTGDYGMSFGAFCKVIRPLIANKKYLGFYFQSPQYRHLISEASAGININNIRAEDLDGLVIEIPSESEQEERCSVLDKVEKAILLRRQQIQKLNDLVKSQFIEMFGDPITNAKLWPTDTVERVCERIYGGGTPSKSRPEFYDGQIPWVTPKDMKTTTIVDSVDHITEDAIKCSATNIVPKGAVLMVIRSGILKHTLPVALSGNIVTINQDMKAFVVRKEIINAAFLLHYFQAIEKDVLSEVRGVTADNIDFKAFVKRKVILPPIDLQNQFAAFVEQTDKSKIPSEIEVAA